MRRAIPRIIRPFCRPVAHPTPLLAGRQFSVSAPQAVEKTDFSWQDRLRWKLWGKNAPEEPVVVDRKIENMEGYVEAIDARGLRIVGLEEGLGEWDVPTFTTNTRFESPEALVRAVYRAIVEVHTFSLNNIPPTFYYTGPENFSENVLVAVAPDGSATFNYQLPEIEQAILSGKDTENMEIRAYTEEEVYPVVSEGEAERPAWLGEGLGKTGWANLPLKQELLFDVVKRVAQLTGRRLPDPEVSKMKTVVDLLEYLEFKPKPKKLYERLTELELQNIPNVKVFGSKLRPWDKERMIGRERPFEKVVEYRYPFEEPAGR